MKKLLILITLMSSLIISGCAQSKELTIKSKEFTDEQNEILYLTGNRAFKYDLTNFPKDKSYELNIVYEVYENKEKIKEENILGMVYEPTDEKLDDSNISISIQENKIRIMSNGASSHLEIDEDISKLTSYYFTGERSIKIGDEVYLFHGNDSGSCSTTERLGSLSKEELNTLIEENKLNIFIKLSCKEIKE